MTTTTTISAANFTNTKAGYKKYIIALGYTSEIADRIIMGYDAAGAYFIESYKEFQRLHITNESEIDKMYNDLEAMNERWLEMTQEGQDDKDMYQDAYHMRINIRNLIDRIEKIENQKP